MKKVLAVVILLTMATVMLLPICAQTIAFRTRSAEEEPYVYMEMGSNDPGDGKSRYHDATSFIIYEFPCPEGSKYASLTWKMQAQYQVSVTNTDPDDEEAFEIIDINKPTDDEVASGKADWGYSVGIQYPTYDLSKWCQGNKKGKIWVMMSDADTTNGWGGYIFGDFDVTYYVGAEPGAVIEKPKTTAQLQDEALKLVPAGAQGFVTWHDSEKPFIYYATDGCGNSSGSRFMDGTNYVIYQFTINPGDTYAGIEWVLNNQYLIEVNTTNPDDEKAWTVLDEAQQTTEEVESGSPSWGGRNYVLTPDIEKGADGYKATLYIYRHDLSQFCKGNTTGKIWIRMGDAAPDAGWGGYISVLRPVVFKSGTAPITWAASGFPLYGTDFIETADTAGGGAAGETPADNSGAGSGSAGSAGSTSSGGASSPSTFDALSVVAIVAFAALGTAVVIKKKR